MLSLLQEKVILKRNKSKADLIAISVDFRFFEL